MTALRLASVLALASTAAAKSPAASFDPADYLAGDSVGAYNLEVVPIMTRLAPPYDEYAVLEELQAAKQVSIREMPDGGEVPRLRVKNGGRLPLYLLGGEVLLGGQQDRMVREDTVLDPGERRAVPVVCVEAGRWNGFDLSLHPSGLVAHPGLRKLALFRDQGEVWNEVARQSAKAGVSSPTGTYRRVLQDAKTRARVASYIDELQRKISRTDKLAGLAVAINGDLEVVDLFDSPPLYAKLERKLLASYVLAAIERQPGVHTVAKQFRAKSKTLQKQDIDGFLGIGANSTPNSLGSLGTNGTSANVFGYKGKAVHGTFFKPTATPQADSQAPARKNTQ